jgi:hypothetical protein
MASSKSRAILGVTIAIPVLGLLWQVVSHFVPKSSAPTSQSSPQTSVSVGGAGNVGIGSMQGGQVIVGSPGATTRRGNQVQFFEDKTNASLDGLQSAIYHAIWWNRDEEGLEILSRNPNARMAFTSGSMQQPLQQAVIQKLAEFPDDWQNALELLPRFGWNPNTTAPFLVAYGKHVWPNGVDEGPRTLEAMATAAGLEIRRKANPRGPERPETAIDPRTFQVTPLLIAVWANNDALARRLIALGSVADQQLTVHTFPIWKNGKQGEAEIALRYTPLSEAIRLRREKLINALKGS